MSDLVTSPVVSAVILALGLATVGTLIVPPIGATMLLALLLVSRLAATFERWRLAVYAGVRIVPAPIPTGHRVAEGGTALDPDVVGQLLATSRNRNPLDALTPRETEVLQLMAEGRSNKAIAKTLVISDGAVEKHVSNIFMKLDLPIADEDHRRVLAVLRYLEATP